jgi:hypothetical protein
MEKIIAYLGFLNTSLLTFFQAISSNINSSSFFKETPSPSSSIFYFDSELPLLVDKILPSPVSVDGIF